MLSRWASIGSTCGRHAVGMARGGAREPLRSRTGWPPCRCVQSGEALAEYGETGGSIRRELIGLADKDRIAVKVTLQRTDRLRRWK